MGEIKLCSLVPLFRVADEENVAIGAFNVNFYAQAEGILEGLMRANSPGIIQASRGANKFQGGADKIQEMVLLAMKNLGTDIPICLHLDHGDLDSAKSCIDGGFSSVMVDYSTVEDPVTKEKVKRPLEENIAKTLEAVLIAHGKGVSVEGEMGVLKGKEEHVESKVSIYPTVEEVLRYCNETGVDAIAVACGTLHGLANGGYDGLQFKLIEDCHRQLRDRGLLAGLVLHGSSTVPIEIVREINKYGGKLAEESKVPLSDIKRAISLGVRKVNIDTDLRLGITATFRKYFNDNPRVEEYSTALSIIKQDLAKDAKFIDPRDYLKSLINWSPELLRVDYRTLGDVYFRNVMDLVKERVASHVYLLVNEFGSAGLADRVK